MGGEVLTRYVIVSNCVNILVTTDTSKSQRQISATISQETFVPATQYDAEPSPELGNEDSGMLKKPYNAKEDLDNPVDDISTPSSAVKGNKNKSMAGYTDRQQMACRLRTQPTALRYGNAGNLSKFSASDMVSLDRNIN